MLPHSVQELDNSNKIQYFVFHVLCAELSLNLPLRKILNIFSFLLTLLLFSFLASEINY